METGDLDIKKEPKDPCDLINRTGDDETENKTMRKKFSSQQEREAAWEQGNLKIKTKPPESVSNDSDNSHRLYNQFSSDSTEFVGIKEEFGAVERRKKNRTVLIVQLVRLEDSKDAEVEKYLRFACGSTRARSLISTGKCRDSTTAQKKKARVRLARLEDSKNPEVRMFRPLIPVGDIWNAAKPVEPKIKKEFEDTETSGNIGENVKNESPWDSSVDLWDDREVVTETESHGPLEPGLTNAKLDSLNLSEYVNISHSNHLDFVEDNKDNIAVRPDLLEHKATLDSQNLANNSNDFNDPEFEKDNKFDIKTLTESLFLAEQELNVDPLDLSENRNISISNDHQLTEDRKDNLEKITISPNIWYLNANLDSPDPTRNRNIKYSESREDPAKKSRKKLQCDICQKWLCNKYSLKRHVKGHSSEKLFSCTLCDKRFHLKEFLNLHKKIHRERKPFECDLCQARFSCKEYLKCHVILHTGVYPYECVACQKVYKSKSSFSRHMRLVHERKNAKFYECGICRKSFIDMNGLKQHISSHAARKERECKTCGEELRTRRSFEKHVLSHTAEKPYECSICQNRFKRSYTLREHMFNNHTLANVSRVRCEHPGCEMTFGTKAHLKRHRYVHAALKPDFL